MEFLEWQFRTKKLSFVHKKESETGALDDPLAKESVINGTIKPAASTSRQAVQLRFCYYRKMETGLYLPNIF